MRVYQTPAVSSTLISCSSLVARAIAAMTLATTLCATVSAAPPVWSEWTHEWPRTDFTSVRIDLGEIRSGGPPRDGIPALVDPTFRAVEAVTDLAPTEPVIVLTSGQETRGYPLRVLMWHEIVNDVINGRPVIVTYCPLCNASLVYDRRMVIDGRAQTLVFGVSGKLRHSDMIMYDHLTESWWQQFTGEAVVGAVSGMALERIASQTLPYSVFAERYPRGLVLEQPTDRRRRYGLNPYVRYDGETWPFLYDGRYDERLPPLSYVVVVGDNAWPLEDIRRQRTLRHGDILITWQSGMNSALDNAEIGDGRDIGYVEVVRMAGSERLPLSYDVTFAFAFKAFYPGGIIHSQ